MQVARDARSLGFDGAGAEMPEQKNIFQRRTDVQRHSFQPCKIFLVKRTVRALAVDEKQPPGGLIVLVEGHCHERADAKFLLGGAGKARQVADGAVIAAVPAEARAGAL